jgi:Zn-dependent protease
MLHGTLHYIGNCVWAIGLHELAHVLVALAFGVRIKRIGISWRGPYIVREQGFPFANLCIALAGPVLNLILAIAYWSSMRQFALINLVLGVSNLVPAMPGGDGQHVAAAIRNLRFSEQARPL